jgi:branched-chain amino acid transport system substrate-binding protein
MSKASVKDKDAFRAALKSADFKSVRGSFTFNTNNHPIQDIYVREVVKEGDVLTNKIIGTAFEKHGDAYAELCKM